MAHRGAMSRAQAVALMSFIEAIVRVMLLLWLSIAVLAAGPALYKLVTYRAQAYWALDGFVLASVGGLILLHVLPPTIAAAGGWALWAAGAGLVLPILAERGSKYGVTSLASKALMGVALLGLAAHTVLDGVTLGARAHDEVGFAVALAVLVHRLPVALLVWWLIRPRHGKRWATAALGVIAVGTVLGYGVEESLHGVMSGVGFASLQAFVAGSLMHVLAHQPPATESGAPHDHSHDHAHSHDHCGDCGHDHSHDHSHAGHSHAMAPTPQGARYGALGTLCGLALVVMLPWLEQLDSHALGGLSGQDHGHDHAHGHGHAHGHEALVGLVGYGERFWHLFAESAPALLLGYLLAGLFATMLPRASMRWMRGGGGLMQATKGVIFGLPIPICSCGVVPLYQSLLRRGVPASAAMAFLIATPELGVEALLLSIPLLGIELTVARLVAAASVALLAGVIMGRLVPDVGEPAETAEAAPQPLGVRLRGALWFGLGELVDETGPWILAGLALAALIQPGSLAGALLGLPGVVEVTLFALIGVPLYVCASGATPMAAGLVFAGASPGAAIAFLLAGPATNVTTFGVLSQLHGKRIAAIFGVVVVGLSVASGVTLDYVLDVTTIKAGPESHEAHGAATWYQVIAAAGLILVCLASLLRVGPRHWLRVVFSFGDHGHDHDHHPEHGGHAAHADPQHDHHHHHH